MTHEPVAGEHGQRRPRDQQRVGLVDEPIGSCHNIFGHALAEIDDVGLEHAGAARAVQITERRGVGDDRVGVGGHRQPADRLGALDEPRVERFQPLGQRGAARGVTAAQADHPRVAAVQVDDVSAARLGMQQVDVLGDHAGDHRCILERGQRPVAGVGQRVVHVPPADVVARPVPLPERRIAGELADRHRIAGRRLGPAVVRNARVGGDARTGQHRDPPTGQHRHQFRGFRAGDRHVVQGTSQPRQSAAVVSSADMFCSIILQAAAPSSGSMCATASVGMTTGKCRT